MQIQWFEFKVLFLFNLIKRFSNILNIKSSLEISVVKLDQENRLIQNNLLDSKLKHNQAIEESETRALEVSSNSEIVVVK